MPNSNTKHYLHLHLLVFLWGFTAPIGKLISIEALPLVWWRVVIGLVFLGAWMVWQKKSFHLPVQTVIALLFAGMVIALHWVTFFKAIKVSNVSVTLACISTGAFFASVLEPVLLGKKIVVYEILIGLLVVLGLGIAFKVEIQYWQGIVLSLISAFLSALFSIINARFAKQYSAYVISFYELLGGVVLLTILLAGNGDFTPHFFKLKSSDFFWIVILATVYTAYAMIASVGLMKYLTPYTVMLTINLEPIYGIIIALLIFGDSEAMSSSFYFGGLLILATVLLNGYLKTRVNK